MTFTVQYPKLSKNTFAAFIQGLSTEVDGYQEIPGPVPVRQLTFLIEENIYKNALDASNNTMFINCLIKS